MHRLIRRLLPEVTAAIALLAAAALSQRLQAETLKATLGPLVTVIPPKKFGFNAFSDQPISILSQQPPTFLMVVGWSSEPGGPSGSTVLMRGDSFESAKPVKVVLAPGREANAYDGQYAGINCIYSDKQRDELLAFTHCEKPTPKRPGGGPAPFYASVALAVSKDNGQTFTKLGPILTGVPEDPKWTGYAQGNAEGSVTTDPTGQWLYLYYTDHSRTDPASGRTRSVITCVARSKLGDGGRPGTWKKYFQGDFSEPGLGGKDSEVANCWAANVTYVPEMRRYIMVGVRDGLCFFTSQDGIHWSGRTGLTNDEDVYVDTNRNKSSAWHPCLVLSHANEHEASGDLFYAYAPNAEVPTYLCRRTVRFTLGAGHGKPQVSEPNEKLADRLKGTKWMRNGQPDTVFEWTSDGGLKRNGQNCKWKVLDDTSVEVKVGSRIDRWVFAADMKTVVQFGDSGKWKSTWKRVED